MTKVIITVDLGHFKAYRVTKNPNESAKVDLLDSYDFLDTHGKTKDKLSDAEGCFPRGGKARVGSGSGEPHNIETETEKKVICRIVDDINSLVKKEGSKKWYLAAGNGINSQILKNLDPAIRAKLDKNIKADLTKTAKSRILEYFKD